MKALAILSFFLLPLLVQAQEKIGFGTDTFYISFHEDPQYVGGEYTMYEYISHQLSLHLQNYQKDIVYEDQILTAAKSENETLEDGYASSIKGYRIFIEHGYESLMRVFLNEHGQVMNVEMDFRSRDAWMLREIEQVLYSMPAWKPARVDGEAVPAVVYIPIELYVGDNDLMTINYHPLFPNSYFYAVKVKPARDYAAALAGVFLSIGLAVFFGLVFGQSPK